MIPALLGPVLAHGVRREFTKNGVDGKSISGLGSE
jgi:hypothetical protein